MAKVIKVWDGTTWQYVGVQAALPSDYVDTTALNSALGSYKQEVNLAISANTTLVAGRRYFVDTTAARTLTLPASPTLDKKLLYLMQQERREQIILPYLVMEIRLMA